MKKLVSALGIALLLSVNLVAAQSTFKACSKDHKVVSLAVDYDEFKDHNVAAHLKDSFSKMAEKFNASEMNSHETFVEFMSNLDDYELEAMNGFPEGAPRVVEGESCK